MRTWAVEFVGCGGFGHVEDVNIQMNPWRKVNSKDTNSKNLSHSHQSSQEYPKILPSKPSFIDQVQVQVHNSISISTSHHCISKTSSKLLNTISDSRLSQNPSPNPISLPQGGSINLFVPRRREYEFRVSRAVSESGTRERLVWRRVREVDFGRGIILLATVIRRRGEKTLWKDG